MIRAAAKNYRHVTVALPVGRLRAARRRTRRERRGDVARDARTDDARGVPSHSGLRRHDRRRRWTGGLERRRCGSRFAAPRPAVRRECAPEATLLRERAPTTRCATSAMLGGKELSYNNIVDLHAALEAVRDLEPTGVRGHQAHEPLRAVPGGDGRQALELAWRSDPVSAFGSVVAFNVRSIGRRSSFSSSTPPIALDGSSSRSSSPRRSRRRRLST